MAEDNSNPLQEAPVNNAKWIDRVLWAFAILGGTIVLLKFTKKNTFSWAGVEFDMNRAWIVFIFLTVAHLYTTLLFHLSVVKFSKRSTESERQKVFARVTSSGGLFVRGLIPRTERVGNVYRMNWSDPTTLASYLAALLIIVAIVPFDFSNRNSFFKYLLVALLIMVVNWFVGSRWAVTLSQLAVETGAASAGVTMSTPRIPFSSGAMRRSTIEQRHRPPCPYCGARLRTASARQCPSCFRSWHEQK